MQSNVPGIAGGHVVAGSAASKGARSRKETLCYLLSLLVVGISKREQESVPVLSGLRHVTSQPRHDCLVEVFDQPICLGCC